MIKKNKIYTKEEFKKLLEGEDKLLIGEYYLNDKVELADFYISSNSKLTDKQKKMMDEGKLEMLTLLKLNELYKLEDEAFDRVWYDRSFSTGKNLDPKEKKIVLNNIKRVKNKYKIKDSDINDFYHGYWSGILALIRYLRSNMFNHKDLEKLTSGIVDS